MKQVVGFSGMSAYFSCWCMKWCSCRVLEIQWQKYSASAIWYAVTIQKSGGLVQYYSTSQLMCAVIVEFLV